MDKIRHRICSVKEITPNSQLSLIEILSRGSRDGQEGGEELDTKLPESAPLSRPTESPRVGAVETESLSARFERGSDSVETSQCEPLDAGGAGGLGTRQLYIPMLFRCQWPCGWATVDALREWARVELCGARCDAWLLQCVHGSIYRVAIVHSHGSLGTPWKILGSAYDVWFWSPDLEGI